MRPIKLKMAAFGAYSKPIEINFAEGLGNDNFFLIHGATGSGKTTILDAICFALYGKSSGGSRTGEMMRSEQATANDRTQVEFTFELNDKKYKILRNPSYMRPKLRGGEGLTEEKAAAQIFVDEKPIETKDVSKYVETLLKFTHEQFRQVIMLPQGAFQKFLLAKSEDKQKVLNTLFNAEFFKRVEDELKIKVSEAKKIFDELTTRKKNYLEEASCTESELPTLIKSYVEQLEAAKVQLKILEAQALDAQKNFNEGEILSKAFKDFEIKSQALDAAQKLLEKILSDLSKAKIELDKRTAEESQRESLKLQEAELAKKKFTLENLRAKRRELQIAFDAFKKSDEEVKRLTKLKKSCEDTMALLKIEVERLQDASAKKISAQKVLEEAQAREKLLAEVATMRNDIAAAEKNFIAASKLHETTEKTLSDLRERQISGSAARLASKLIDGKPCPVCGAIHHPKLAASSTEIPTDEQIKTAESKLKSLAEKKDLAARNLAGLKSKLETKEKALSEGAEIVTVAKAQAEFDKISADVKNLENYRRRIKTGEKKTAETVGALEAAEENCKKLSGEEKTLGGEVSAMEREVDAKYLTNSKLLDEEISAAQRELNQLNLAFERAQKNFNRLNAQVAAQKATVTAEEKNKSEIAAKVEGKTLPDTFSLKKARDDTRAAERKAIEENTRISTRIEQLKELSEKISALKDDLNAADRNFLMWKTLSDVANGKISKISFQRYYLATMFKEVILEANNRLEKMSNGRYRFQLKEDISGRERKAGLDLEIVDDYSGSARPVETLSGGESFLASLSLALGLAAVVQNNAGGIKLDTIFIDEGFGTLDAETLDFAMKTLIELQSGGRLVGIISHVEELKKQIPVRLEVTTSKTGSKAEFKRGLSRD